MGGKAGKQKNNEIKDLKAVLLGSGGVGKSALYVRFIQNIFVHVYDPTIEDHYRKLVTINKQPVMVEILDTASCSWGLPLPQILADYQIFLVVYSMISQSSLEDAKEVMQTITKTVKHPYILALLSNKSDLQNQKQTQTQQGQQTAHEFGALFYEVSAHVRNDDPPPEHYPGVGIQVVVEEVVERALKEEWSLPGGCVNVKKARR